MSGGYDLLQMLVTTHTGNFRPCFDANVALFRDLRDQVSRHAQGETSTTHQHDHLSSIIGEEDRGLASGVPASDHEHPLPSDTVGLLTRGPVQYAPAKQTVQSRNFDPMPMESNTARADMRSSPSSFTQ